jgi:hypothetical protein
MSAMRFGIVGTGYWARQTHAAALAAHPDADLVGVWDGPSLSPASWLKLSARGPMNALTSLRRC